MLACPNPIYTRCATCIHGNAILLEHAILGLGLKLTLDIMSFYHSINQGRDQVFIKCIIALLKL